MEDFKVNWNIEDGYIGQSRPQSFYISECEIYNDMDEEDLAYLFNSLMDEDFQKKVEPVSEDLEDFILWAKNVIENREEEEDEDD